MPNQIRTLFISDVHLGTRGCQAAALLDFLKSVEPETIYLVGDIIDGWRLRGTWYWPQLHNDVVQKLLRRARRGTKIVFIPGNHDEFLRSYVNSAFGNIEIVDRAIHKTADGRRILVLHGDQFDTVVRNVKWLAHLGDWAYNFALGLNRYIGLVRRLFGLSDWSFAAYAKQKVKSAVSFIGAFEETVATAAAREKVDGVMCGHIHHPVIRWIGGIQYLNTGDWVESCSGIVKHLDGRLELVMWDHREREEVPVEPIGEMLPA
jgi:UDP-2,3-diacylglucosamine pyrophosphatase LpxH